MPFYSHAQISSKLSNLLLPLKYLARSQTVDPESRKRPGHSPAATISLLTTFSYAAPPFPLAKTRHSHATEFSQARLSIKLLGLQTRHKHKIFSWFRSHGAVKFSGLWLDHAIYFRESFKTHISIKVGEGVCTTFLIISNYLAPFTKYCKHQGMNR